MREITVIVGLPASGKTFFARSLVACQMDIVVDDPQSLDELPSNFSHLIIADPNLCITSVREQALKILSEKYLHAKITVVYFENNPDQCYINMSKRNSKPVVEFIKLLTKHYIIPENSITKEVWKG